MSGFYITELRLKAEDFPGQVALFTNLKTPVYFRNSTLEYIRQGGWADLPKTHYVAFIKALKEGWVRGERGWHLDYANFVQKWRIPSWTEIELTAYANGVETVKMTSYISRCKELLAGDIIRPFTNNPNYVPPPVIKHIVECLEKTPVKEHAAEYYSILSSNIGYREDKDIAHRTFLLLKKRIEYNYRYAQIEILDSLSQKNPEDRKTFMSWLFKSCRHLAQVKDSNYSVTDIIITAVLKGEVWYTEQPDENQGTVSTTTCTKESSGEVCRSPLPF